MDIQAESERYRTIFELGNAFASRLGLGELIPLVISKCREVLDADGVSVMLLDEERDELYFPYISQDDPEVARRLFALRLSASHGIAGAVLRARRAEKIDDSQSDPRHYSGVDQKTGVTTKSMLAAPLLCGDTCLGVIEAVNHRGGTPFSNADLALFEQLARSIAVAIDNARRFGEVKASADRLRMQVGALRRDLARGDRFGGLVTASPAMLEVSKFMESAALSPIPVLIEGETGTGKELVARGIHRASPRAEGPFVAVNCAALPESLLESELFGHRRGAFTGATDDHPGLFKAATGGVIFLDEIGEMPLPMQAKLLRVLQENEVTPVGDTRSVKVDVRVISATNRDLKAALAARAFREDLYYRLAVFPIRIPPLRERREDIPFLAARFLEAAAERHHKKLRGLDAAVVDLLSSYDWPGNVRELQNEIERAVALVAGGENVTVEHLSAKLRDAGTPRTAVSVSQPARASRGAARVATPDDHGPCQMKGPLAASLPEARAAFEAQYISEVLHRHDGNVSRAAAALGVSRVALQKKMKRYGLR
jgi:Nif-specific regulatory protein